MALRTHGYLPDEGLATAVFLALTLRRPLLLEGEAGVGKTEVAKVLSRVDRRRADPPAVLRGHRRRPGRLRLGLRAPAAPPARRRGQRRGSRASAPTRLEDQLYHERFLLKRALLQAIDHRRRAPAGAADRRDRPRRRRVRGLPARGAVGLPDHHPRARQVPRRRVRRSSCSRRNRTRDVHDALKRRCLYHWVEHPGFDREVAIVRLRVPDVSEPLARQVAAAVEALRGLNLYKPPGVAETIDWATALGALGVDRARRALGRGHARRRAQVPRGSRAGRASTASPTWSSRRFERAACSEPCERHRLDGHAGGADGRSPFARVPARRGARRADRQRADRSPRRSAQSASSAAATSTGRRARRSCAAPRTSNCSTGRSPSSGTHARRPPATTTTSRRRRRSRWRSTTTTVDDDGDDGARRPTTTRRSTLRFSADRGAAPQGLRRLHDDELRRPSS